MAPRQFQGEIRDTPAYKLGFKHREEKTPPDTKRYKDRLKKLAYLVGYHSERHREAM